jgi:rhamnose utilization protein RhaD (predicted bifunctional aldolase and dehydrogenase)
MSIQQTVIQLSHEFGTVDFVRGGGGNTSCKEGAELWVKPSGTTLAGLTSESLVAVDRQRLSALYTSAPPQDSADRESFVSRLIQEAVLPGISGRASVETPLHDSLQARYVVHTHPALVNGMTCAKNGGEVAAELFPDALWVDYVDPGYTLCMHLREKIGEYRSREGKDPETILLKNHGVVVSGDTPEEIRAIYAALLDTLQTQYKAAGVATALDVGPLPDSGVLDASRELIERTMPGSARHVESSGAFELSAGPITPDHIVYSKSYPFVGEPTADTIEAFGAKHGYLPQVIAFNGAVFGVGDSAKSASLALELAQDGALVRQLADAFGGINYMSDRAREFIENWEVESYRKKQMDSG